MSVTAVQHMSVLCAVLHMVEQYQVVVTLIDFLTVTPTNYSNHVQMTAHLLHMIIV
jgi:hypothetical protein